MKIPNYLEFIFESLLIEAGDLKKPYPWKFAGKKPGYYEYIFKDKDKDDFSCWFQQEGTPAAHAYSVKFDIIKSNAKDDELRKKGIAVSTNKNDVMNVLSTVFDIMSDFINREGFVKYLIIDGAPNENEKLTQKEVTNRARLYYTLLMKHKNTIFGKTAPKITINKSEIFIEL